jgi:DNA-binding HxlR family transcriptional regulator
MALPKFAPECPATGLPTRLGDKWTSLLVLVLEDGPLRFSEIEAALDRRVTPKVLTESLRALERDGFLTRTAEGEPPTRRVTYELTALGRTFLEPLAATRAWCDAHLDELLAARAAHDTAG